MLLARRAAAVLGSAIALGGCFGGADADKPAARAPASPPPRVSGADARVIRAWSDALRTGRRERAAGLFAVPATVQNGAGAVLLDSRAMVRQFNDSLPCGARLLRTTPRGRYTIGTFRLTGRPGGDCGPGTGEEAATAFLIHDGRIVEWLRVAVPPDRPPRAPEPNPERPRPAPGAPAPPETS